MFYTFSAHFMGSTEQPTSTEKHLREYALHCNSKHANRKPVTYKVWSLQESLAEYRKVAEYCKQSFTMTEDELRQRKEAAGYVFFATPELAEDAAKTFVQLGESVLDEVYGNQS